MQRLHPATIVIEAVDFLRQFVWALILILFTGSRREEFDSTELILVGFGVITVFVAVFRYLTMYFGVVGETLVIRKGLIWKQERTIPLERIQNVNLKRGILEQILGVVTVTIETASGIGVEANLRVLSVTGAESIRRVLLHSPKQADEPNVIPEAPPILYQATAGDLALCGAFSNRALYLLALLLGAFPIFGSESDVIKKVLGPIFERVTKLPPFEILLLIFVGVAIGWLGSIMITLMQLWNFRVEGHQKGVEVHYGLFTQFKTLIPLRRVVGVRVAHPVLFRKINRCEVFADSAGSILEQSPAGANRIAPILRTERLPSFAKLALPNLNFDFRTWNPVSSKAIRRGFFAYFKILLLLIGASSFWLGAIALWLIIPAIPIALFAGYVRFKNLGYARPPGFFAARDGFWRNNMVVVPLDRIQSIYVSQSPFQRIWKVAELQCITASNTGMSHFQIPDLDESEAYRLQDEVITEVEKLATTTRGGV